MTVVAVIVARYIEPRPSNIVRVSWEMIVSSSEYTPAIFPVRYEMLRNSVPRMMDIQISVIPALRLRGSLKAVIPFEMASTPVNAVVPFANA